MKGGSEVGEFHVEVVRIGPVSKHPDADTLSLTMVRGGYPVIMRTGDFAEGDLAVYVPVDAVVPADDPRWEFLDGHRRIRARRLRGVFSMGLLTKPAPEWPENYDCAEAMRIVKFEPAEEMEVDGEDEKDPGLLPVYDIEGLRRWSRVLVPGEDVAITEKLHGENARFVHDGTRLWCASRTRFKQDSRGSKWWQAARKYDLAEKLATIPNIGLYGEVHGYTGGFPYAVQRGNVGLRFFDALDVMTRKYLSVDEFTAICFKLDLPTAPFIYRGTWDAEKCAALADGPSTLDGSHVREGFVVRPTTERYDHGCGRVILKLHGEAFLTRGKAK